MKRLLAETCRSQAKRGKNAGREGTAPAQVRCQRPGVAGAQVRARAGEAGAHRSRMGLQEAPAGVVAEVAGPSRVSGRGAGVALRSSRRGQRVSPPAGQHLLPRASSPTARKPLEDGAHVPQPGGSRRTRERP